MGCYGQPQLPPVRTHNPEIDTAPGTHSRDNSSVGIQCHHFQFPLMIQKNAKHSLVFRRQWKSADGNPHQQTVQCRREAHLQGPHTDGGLTPTAVKGGHLVHDGHPQRTSVAQYILSVLILCHPRCLAPVLKK
ncbi:hypothetical protein DQ04_02861080 [Trypanosoma grayi]|uniref:hypothetical protein n=1 Tax=Trypanosoma grayi TaxID=71804 RepID=UPI0004F4348C|nr:hypothetical protein DQ04_02861080 [Trypanosoma grayi]KEG11208.1 hypothetical protein DQ04_02861080 [Trypanosoma grayi]